MASSTSTTAAEGRHLTTADIVAIQKERAFRLGELGFQINFPEFQEVVNAQHASKATNGQPVDSGLLAQDDHAVNAAIQKTCNALIQLQKYEKLLKENKPLVENAESEIDAILLAAGKSKRYLAEQDLRKKVNEAIKLRSPIPAPNYFTVFISDPSVGIGIKEDDMLAVNLPLQTSLDEVYMLLNYIVRAEVLARCNTTGEDPQAVANDEVVWKYELLSKDLSTTLENKPAMLKAARDLERMKRAVAEGCIAVLARVRRGPG